MNIKYKAIPSWTINIAGKPMRKELCLVLWRKSCIPQMPPRLPPMRARKNSLASLTLLPPDLALSLSMPMVKKSRRLIISRYAPII